MIPESLMPLQGILDCHERYRAKTLNLIASENQMSPIVEGYFRPDLSHRYGDYVGADVFARKYTGNRYLAELDAGAQNAVRSLFGCRFADLRPLSGHVAGIAVIMALCRPGDTVLELDSTGGGHRLAEKLSVAPLCPLRVLPIPMEAATYNIDIPATQGLIERERPRLVILGSSLFLFPHPVREIADAVHAVDGHLLFDASHVLGLIAGRAYPNPLSEGADILTSSTHKTFAGPQGGLLLADDEELFARIIPAIYPAIVTNHHLHRLPALWAACEEWQTFGKEHTAAIVANARALAVALDTAGLPVVGKTGGYTATHTILLACENAKQAALRLEEAGILVTSVGLPQELGGGCLRLGVQEITRRGFRPEQAKEMADLITAALSPNAPVTSLAERVATLTASWQEWRFTWSGVEGNEAR